MKIGKKVIGHLGLCGVLLACGRGALALECHLDSENGITEESENIGGLTVAADLPLGSRLWTSRIMTRNVVCWAQGSTKGEWVYFYGNPVGDVVRPGIGMGLIYNDADLGIVKAGSKVQTDMWRLKNKPEKGQVKYQIYLEKIGEIKGGAMIGWRCSNWMAQGALTVRRGKTTAISCKVWRESRSRTAR